MTIEFLNHLSSLLPKEWHQQYLQPEQECVQDLLSHIQQYPQDSKTIEQYALKLVQDLRTVKKNQTGIASMMAQYDLSSEEGVVMMCLAEALLRIPDSQTADMLIEDKIHAVDFSKQTTEGKSLFANAANWGLVLTGKILNKPDQSADQEQHWSQIFSKAAQRLGAPVIRQAVKQFMKTLGKHYVIGETIEKSLDHIES